MDSDYNGDKSQDFMEDVRQLAEQYGYKIIMIKVEEKEAKAHGDKDKEYN